MADNEKPEGIINNKIEQLDNRTKYVIKVINITYHKRFKNIIQIHAMNGELMQFDFAEDTEELDGVEAQIMTGHPLSSIIIRGDKNGKVKPL